MATKKATTYRVLRGITTPASVSGGVHSDDHLRWETGDTVTDSDFPAHVVISDLIGCGALEIVEDDAAPVRRGG